ncbi:MAG TPA: hypothetical protein VF288_10245 [Mycobacteriales bacterium]
MRTHRITLVAAAGATLVAGIAAPAAAHTATHHATHLPTLGESHAHLAATSAREEAFLAQAKTWVAGSSALSAAEKQELTQQLDAALADIASAAATGAAATTVPGVFAADGTADQAFWGVLRTVFDESATITTAEHTASTVAGLQAKLAALVAQYGAHSVPAPPSAAEASTLLAGAAGDATAARAAAVSDPATAARDLAAARADQQKAVADIAATAHALAAALRTAPPPPVAPVAFIAPPTKPAVKPVSSPTATRPCDGHHVAYDPDRRGWDTGYRGGHGSGTDGRHHDGWDGHGGSGHHATASRVRQASYHY